MLSSVYQGVVRRLLARGVRAAVLVGAVLLSTSCDQWITKPMRYETVTLTVKRRNGIAVPGVKMVLYTGQREMGYGVTDSAGAITFPQVPWGVYGLYAYEFPSGYWATAGYGGQYIDGISIDGKPLAPFQFTAFKEGSGTIVVRTVDSVGTGIPNVIVRGYDQKGNTRATVSDSTGQVVFSVGMGVWSVNAENPGFIVNRSLPALVTKIGITIDSGYVDAARLVLSRCSGSYRVRVQDAAGSVPNFPVLLYKAEGLIGVKTTGSDGTYTWTNQLCGSYGMMLMPFAGWTFVDGPGTSYSQFTIGPNATVPQVTFTVAKICKGSYRVRVQDVNGAPVPNFSVLLYTGAATVGVQSTGADGTATWTNQPCGGYGVMLMPSPDWTFPDGPGKSYADGLAISDGATVPQITFAITKVCKGSYRVRVVDAAGAPVPNYPVMLYTASGPVSTQSTGADGTATWTNQPCGGYGVMLLPSTGWTYSEGPGKRYIDGLTITSGSTVPQVTLTVTKAP